jgi:hypothetical protein
VVATVGLNNHKCPWLAWRERATRGIHQ